MPPPVNLANVNISLAQFDAISAGKYNAGEVKLSGENALVKVNNHITQRGKNNVEISHAETGAVTIRYSEPEGFPVKFHWEATVGVDGKTATTPLVIEEAAAQ